MSADLIARLFARVADLERRMANMMRAGPVEEVDAAKGLCRLRVGGTDDKPHLSAWIPYAQKSGQLKAHIPPSKGQPMLMLSPNGDPKQARAVADSWSDANPSPNKSGDENTVTFGAWRFTLGKDKLSVSGPTLEWSGDVEFKSGTLKHDGVNVGKDHLHTQVEPGGGLSGVPKS